jgi:hypothetical protein
MRIGPDRKSDNLGTFDIRRKAPRGAGKVFLARRFAADPTVTRVPVRATVLALTVYLGYLRGYPMGFRAELLHQGQPHAVKSVGVSLP